MKLYNVKHIKKNVSNENNQSKLSILLKAVYSKNIHISFDKNGNSEQNRDRHIPAKTAQRNTTEHQGPKGNVCLTPMLLPRVPPYCPSCHPAFSLFPTVPSARVKLAFQNDAVTRRLHRFWGGSS